MTLTTPAPREALHDRHIGCRGFRRADGLWDIEAHLVDTKTYAFPNTERGRIGAGEPVHEMWIRVTVDDDFVVKAVEAAMDATPYRVCPEITPAYAILVGHKIGPGWSGTVRRLLGGTKGCRHLLELLAPVATVAFQTIAPLRERVARDTADAEAKPPHLDSCHALASDGAVVKRHYPNFYTGK
ncbi:MAG TPA: DUF2889 domain-containing protein [Alphaproteobacteria bacterium]|nr:DUF2889 domain-containing protein [Alphaproteobacteria bacterium]